MIILRTDSTLPSNEGRTRNTASASSSTDQTCPFEASESSTSIRRTRTRPVHLTLSGRDTADGHFKISKRYNQCTRKIGVFRVIDTRQGKNSRQGEILDEATVFEALLLGWVNLAAAYASQHHDEALFQMRCTEYSYTPEVIDSSPRRITPSFCLTALAKRPARVQVSDRIPIYEVRMIDMREIAAPEIVGQDTKSEGGAPSADARGF
jgi:hypothetical protein